jgi:hypothetical protein
VGIGVFLVIVGAILAFAVRRDTAVVDLQVVGLILIVAGAALIYNAHRSSTKVKETTVVDDTTDPNRPVHRVHEVITDQDPGSNEY